MRARDRATEYFSRRGLTVRFMEGIKFGNDGDRTSVESLQNAIAEMRVLSMCDEIVGSYGSSFSAVAASWGAIILNHDIERTDHIGTLPGTNHAGDSRVEDIARQLAMRRRFLTTKDVMKACPRLKIGKNRIGTKAKDFRRIVKKAKVLNIFKPLPKTKIYSLCSQSLS